MTEPYYQDDAVTLYHGDCLELADVWTGADVLVTDPPYGMALRSGWSGHFGNLAIQGDETLGVRDGALALWGDMPGLVFGRWSEPKPKGTRMTLTWEKGEHVGMGDLRLPWKPNTEEIYVLGGGFTGSRTTSVLKHNAVSGTVTRKQGSIRGGAPGPRMHPTEKPEPLMRDLIAKCPPGVIADPFAGSGTTLVAAKALGRKAVGIELDERYCETAARRLAQGVLDFGQVS